MINQKMLLAIVAGFAVMMVLGGLFHLVILKDYFEAKVGHSELMYPLLSYGILAILMAYIYPMLKMSGTLIMGGLCFGILMGLMCRTPWEVIEIGYGRGDWGFVITEAIWHSIEEGIGGIAIAMVYGRAAA